MAKHIVKCLYCGKSFDASEEEFVKPNARRYAHKTCHEKAEAGKTKEEKDKAELENYIKQLFGINSISPKIKKQIETFHSQNNYSYTGIRKTLVYFFEIRGNDISKANGGIGIVPYTYDAAHQYWYAIWEAQQRNEQIQQEQVKIIMPAEEVHINAPQREPMKRLRKLFTFLDEEESE